MAIPALLHFELVVNPDTPLNKTYACHLIHKGFIDIYIAIDPGWLFKIVFTDEFHPCSEWDELSESTHTSYLHLFYCTSEVCHQVTMLLDKSLGVSGGV